MSNEKNEHQAVDIDRTKIKQTSAARWRRWHFRSRILLMILAAIAVVMYLLRSKQYEGIGAALCAFACGGFLIWHVIHLFAEQDALEEQFIEPKQPKISSPEPNHAGKETNSGASSIST
jgi:hypothetical protein